MSFLKRIAAASGAPVAFALAGLALSAGTASAELSGPVVATIKPIHSMVAAVMEGVGDPYLLVPGNVSPHTFTMRPSEARLVDSAAIIFEVGEGLEAFLAGPNVGLAEDAMWVQLSHAAGVTLLPLRQGGVWPLEPAMPHVHGFYDPHFWLDPSNAEAATLAIAATLSAADPANATRYAANANAYVVRIGMVANDLAAELGPVKDSPFIVLHDGYQYFEHAFGLYGAGAVVISPEIPPGARRLVELRATLAANAASCAFAEPQYSPALMATLAEGLDVRLGVLDSIGSDIPAGPDQYPELLRRLGASLASCLSAAA